ncbi:MAG: SAM-dependent chlorinase/fluorinase [Spirulina sp. SIO3F2]|nr:SAM-dependent chlorinase/fluorinase [Spirulina sp. SIO3F2]
MNKLHVITLLTDFGYQDVYVGTMKGILAQIAPHATPIDLTHQISPQDLWAAQFNLGNAYHYFPTNTIHLVVVDPGVGTSRRAIALHTNAGYFVAPDNGVLTPVLQQETLYQAVTLDRSDYWLTPKPSTTFHGQDIFAPIAAHLANGVTMTQLGSPIPVESLVQLPLPRPQVTSEKIVGTVQYIDHFGNCITNIAAEQLTGQAWAIQLDDQTVSIGQTYGDRAPGAMVALIGSHGWLEIALNRGNAQAQLQWRVGKLVTIVKTATT